MNNKIIITAICALFTCSIFAQNNKGQLMLVNYVKVAPANVEAYEAAAFDLIVLLQEAKVDDVIWYANFSDDFTYIYEVPIENMASLDKNYWAGAIEKIGAEKFEAATAKLESLMESSRNEIYYYDENLSYAHPSIRNEENTYRIWTFYQFPIGSGKKVRQLGKDWRDYYSSKDMVLHYEVCFGRFGQNEGTVVTQDYGKDEAEMAKRDAAAFKAMDGEGKDLWERTKALMKDRRTVRGEYIPELTYLPAAKGTEK